MPGQLNNTESFNTAGYQGNLFSLIWKLKAPGNWIFFHHRLFCVMFQCSISNQWCDITHCTIMWMFIPPVFCIWLVKRQEEFREQTKKANSSAPLQKFKTSKYTSLSAPREMKKSRKWKYIHMYTHEQNMSRSHGNLGSNVPNKRGYSSKQYLWRKI